MKVCIVEVEGGDYEGRCFVLVAADVESAVTALKKKYARFKTLVRWHDIKAVDETSSVIEADFDHVPAYFNEHTARFYLTLHTVEGSS